MRKFNLSIFLLSAVIAMGQEPAAPPKESPQPPPVALQPPITITPEMLRNFHVVTLPVSGMCVIPLRSVPIPANVKESGKAVVPPPNVDNMPEMKGLPLCGASPKR
jgi:hypothetical protein